MGCVIRYKGQSISEEQFLQYLNKQITINRLFNENETLANSVYESLGFKTKTSENEITRGIKEVFPYKAIGNYSNIEEGLIGRKQYETKIGDDSYVFEISNYNYENEDGTYQSYYDIDFTVNGSEELVGTGFFDKSEKAKQIIQAIISQNYGNDTIRFNVEESKKGKQRLLLYKRLMNQLGYNPSDEMEYALFYDIKTDKVNLTPQQKQQALQLYSQYLEQNPNGSVEQFKNWVDEFNRNNKLFQESGSLATIKQSQINNLQNTIEYQLLNEKDENLDRKVGQSYIFLSEKDAKNFAYLVEKNKEYPQEFKVTKKITKYEADSKNPLKFNGYNEYIDFYYIKSNNNKKSNLYDIVNKETGEIIASKVRVLSVSKDSKSEIAKKYGLEHTPTKIFSANRSIAFALYRQKPSKAKYIAQAKKYLYDALKFLNKDETSLKINLDKIESLLDSFPEEMWDYINTTYSPEDSTNINASISLQNQIKFNLPKLGFLQEIEKITGLKLLGTSFKNYDRTGSLAKIFKFSKLDGEWGSTITIDNSMTTRELKASVKYYLSTKNIFKPSSEEENVRKYAEHRGIDYNKLKELIFGDVDKALGNILYNNTGNSDTIELSKWRESIRNYDWQSVELFSKPYDNFQNTVKERILSKFKDKKLSNGISHLEYFFNSNSFNWLNINFNNISGQYYMADMETEANVGVETKMGGIINPFEMKIYQKPKAGENFLQEKEVFNRLAAILHEPFHALHALSYGTKEELELRKAFDNLYRTNFGKEMMNQVFGSGYNKGQQVSYDTLYKEFTAFSTQLMLYPKQWIKNTDLRSNDIYEFIEKIQTLQDKTYEEIVKTQQKIGTTETIITEEEKIKLSFLEKLYNYLVKALNKIIPLSKKFTNLIADSKLVEKKVIEDVFGEVEERVTKTLKLPENVKKSKEQFLDRMKELQSAINTLMQIDGKLFSSENVTNFFTNSKFNQEMGSVSDFISQKSQERLNQIKNVFNENPELSNIGTQEQYSQYLDTIFPDSKIKDIVYHFSNTKIDKPDKEKFSLSANINRRKGFFGINKNVNPGNNFANVEGTISHAMLFNMKNPDFGDFSVLPPIVAKNETKDSAIIKQKGDINYYVVFEPEQIHILGSKKDIEGFKNFVSNNNNTIKQGVSEIFNSNSELSNIGTQEQYSQYLESLNKPNTNPVLQGNQQSVITSNDKIIWGHPGIGKTFLHKQGKDDIIDFDSVYKSRINKELGLPEGKDGWKFRNEWRKTHEEEWKQKVRQLWKEAKEEAKETGKQLFASDIILLREFVNDFDKVITMSKETFVNRAKQRNDYTPGEAGTEGWKNNIDIEIDKIDKSKVITTDKYLSDLLSNVQQEQVKKFAELQERLNNKEFLKGAKNAFESSEELQNVYYEALGYDISNIDLKITKTGNRINVITTSSSNKAEIDIDIEGNNAYITNTFVKKGHQGFGTLSYIKLGNELIKQGLTLTSDLNGVDLQESGKALWESLVSKNLAFYNPNIGRYVFLGQQALNAYTDYIARVSLGILKNPSSGGYNYTSKVKDIVYHGTNAFIESFDKNKIASNTLNYGFYGKGFYFNETRNDLINWWKTLYKKEPNIVTAIINTKNPYKEASNVIEEKTKLGNKQETEEFTKNLLQKNYDAVLPQIPKEEGSNEYVVFEPEQIHILGSKQDIEGFKKFILNINSQEENIELNLPSKINQFYTDLTQEEKNKIGDIEKLYNEQTFPMEETEFIDMLKCKI